MGTDADGYRGGDQRDCWRDGRHADHGGRGCWVKQRADFLSDWGNSVHFRVCCHKVEAKTRRTLVRAIAGYFALRGIWRGRRVLVPALAESARDYFKMDLSEFNLWLLDFKSRLLNGEFRPEYHGKCGANEAVSYQLVSPRSYTSG